MDRNEFWHSHPLAPQKTVALERKLHRLGDNAEQQASNDAGSAARHKQDAVRGKWFEFGRAGRIFTIQRSK